MKKLSLNKKALTLVVAVIAILLAVTAPAALAWKEGPGTDWWYVAASYGGYQSDAPLVIKIDGDPASGQVFAVGQTITISGDLYAVAQSCGGDGNGAYTEWLLEVNGPSGPGSTGDWNYDHSSGCAVADVDTTLAITYDLTDAGTHTVYMSSYAAVSQYWTDVADEFANASLTFEVVSCESVEAEVTEACPCERDPAWRNHGEHVSCAAKIVDGYLEAGFIDEECASSIMNPIARSGCGKPSKDL